MKLTPKIPTAAITHTLCHTLNAKENGRWNACAVQVACNLKITCNTLSLFTSICIPWSFLSLSLSPSSTRFARSVCNFSHFFIFHFIAAFHPIGVTNAKALFHSTPKTEENRTSLHTLIVLHLIFSRIQCERKKKKRRESEEEREQMEEERMAKKTKGTEEKRSNIFKQNIVCTTALNCCHFLKYQQQKKKLGGIRRERKSKQWTARKVNEKIVGIEMCVGVCLCSIQWQQQQHTESESDSSSSRSRGKIIRTFYRIILPYVVVQST